MTGLRSATYPGAAYSQVRRRSARRLTAHFVLDLTASVATVLALGWLFQTSANEYALRNVLITQNEIYVAISRFTPANLLFSYAHTAAQAVRGLVLSNDVADNFSAIMRAGLLAVGQLVLELAIAVPRTLFELYQETSGTAAWIVLAGFGMAASAVSTTLLTARVSVWRLLLAAAMCPLAISVVFLGLQGFMVLMLSAFFWLTTLAPYAVACPVLCTLYWVAMPNAERGAVASVAHLVLRMLEPRA